MGIHHGLPMSSVFTNLCHPSLDTRPLADWPERLSAPRVKARSFCYSRRGFFQSGWAGCAADQCGVIGISQSLRLHRHQIRRHQRIHHFNSATHGKRSVNRCHQQFPAGFDIIGGNVETFGDSGRG